MNVHILFLVSVSLVWMAIHHMDRRHIKLLNNTIEAERRLRKKAEADKAAGEEMLSILFAPLVHGGTVTLEQADELAHRELKLPRGQLSNVLTDARRQLEEIPDREMMN